MCGQENGMNETTMTTEKANPTTTDQILTPTQIPTTTTTQVTTPNHGMKTKANPTGKTTGKNGNIPDPQITGATPTTAQTQRTLGTNGRTQAHHQLNQINSHATLSLKRKHQLHKSHLQLFHFQQMHIGKARNYSKDPQN